MKVSSFEFYVGSRLTVVPAWPLSFCVRIWRFVLAAYCGQTWTEVGRLVRGLTENAVARMLARLSIARTQELGSGVEVKCAA